MNKRIIVELSETFSGVLRVINPNSEAYREQSLTLNIEVETKLFRPALFCSCFILIFRTTFMPLTLKTKAILT